MTRLAQLLLRRIATSGPMSVSEFMAECLLHPEFGYYSTRDPFGTAGDFTTAPEISQMFGELVGLALAQAWLEQGSPAPFVLAELGPGRGTLMADLLRATRIVPGFHDAMRLHLIEASPSLRKVQAETLRDHDPQWRAGIEALPDLPLFLVANEFFDALPIRQFRRDRNGWREVQVAARGQELVFGLSAPAPIGLLDHRLDDTQPGDIVEICPPAAAIAARLAERISAHGGAALIFDYGDWRSLGDTLQALRHHESDHPLAHPGEADLTAHVDFEALVRAAPGIAATKMTGQGRFLGRLGIESRARKLAENLQGDALDSHMSAFQRLTDPSEMGTLFKTVAFHPIGTPSPPGYDP